MLWTSVEARALEDLEHTFIARLYDPRRPLAEAELERRYALARHAEQTLGLPGADARLEWTLVNNFDLYCAQPCNTCAFAFSLEVLCFALHQLTNNAKLQCYALFRIDAYRITLRRPESSGHRRLLIGRCFPHAPVTR